MENYRIKKTIKSANLVPRPKQKQLVGLKNFLKQFDFCFPPLDYKNKSGAFAYKRQLFLHLFISYDE